MLNLKQKTLLTILLCVLLTGCSREANIKSVIKSNEKLPDKLIVYSDGTMVLNNGRGLPSKDVVIYSDAFGGEKAAIKMYSGIQPPFYRGSIAVVRKDHIKDP